VNRPIVLLTTGTRGDLQPYLALGLGLRAAGLPVRVASDPRFGDWVRQTGLAFEPVEGNPSDLFSAPALRGALAFGGGLAGSLRASLAFQRAAHPVYARMLETAWRACRGAGALVVGLPSLWGAHIAMALAIPCACAFLQPFAPTRAFASPLLPFALPGWPALNRLSYSLVEQAVWQPWRGLIQRWRTHSLGLPPAPFWGPASRLYRDAPAILTAVSPAVVAPPADLPSNHAYTGFWFLDESFSGAIPPTLEEFLSSGPPPLYVGYGSPGAQDAQLASQAMAGALRQTGLRAVFGVPPAEFPPGLPPGQAIRIDAVAHSMLFPRCAAAVHHGGAGTTAAALRAGIPSLVLPRAADQFFWGRRVQALGAGPVPIPQSHLSAHNLSAAFQQAANSPDLRARAAQLAAQIAAEHGVENAVSRLSSSLGPLL